MECGCPSAAFGNGPSKPAHAFLPLPKGEGRGEGNRPPDQQLAHIKLSGHGEVAFGSWISLERMRHPMVLSVNLIPCRAIASWCAAVLLPLSETDAVSQPTPFSLSPRERAGVHCH